VREVVVTSLMDAEPRGVVALPGPTLWPLALAVSVAIGFVGFLAHPAWLAVGFFLSFVSIAGWLWPDHERWREMTERETHPAEPDE
jgi:cytochrome c oxidase subunit I+III